MLKTSALKAVDSQRPEKDVFTSPRLPRLNFIVTRSVLLRFCQCCLCVVLLRLSLTKLETTFILRIYNVTSAAGEKYFESILYPPKPKHNDRTFKFY